MAYATISDVQALAAARRINATSVPGVTQITQFLQWSAAEIDSVLSSKSYGLPVATSATIAWGVLAKINAQGGWCMAETAAPTSHDKDKACKMYEDSLAAISDSEYSFPGLAKDANVALPRGPGLTQPPTWATPYIRRDQKF